MELDIDSKPNLFIAGFARSGTTALASYLSQHPKIFVPFIYTDKEPNFFYPFDNEPRWINLSFRKIRTLEKYNNLYENKRNYKYRVDGSVSYTYYNGIAQRIKEYNPNAVVLLIIRDQLQRIISAYNLSSS